MPKIKIEKVISFSTEDPVHVAANILSNDPLKKWKCRTVGEKSASIVLQLEKASVISSIDIGNEHSAYIEVLASRSGGSDDFKVLLVMSSFMSPLESRQSQNVNKVRMFTTDQLSQPECDQKWDRIKIVCTQPFNKHVQYGLSFISLQFNEEKMEGTTGPAHIGKFLLRPESPNNLSAGSLFARRKELNDSTPLKAAAAIREACLHPAQPRVKTPIVKKFQQSPSSSPTVNLEAKNRNRNELLYTRDDESANEKIDKVVEKKKKEDEERKVKKAKEDEERLAKKKEEQEKRRKKSEEEEEMKVKKEEELRAKKEKRSPPKKAKEKRGSPKAGCSNEKKKERSPRKRKSDAVETVNKRIKLNRVTKPFNEMLRDVVLVISGIQNPERGNLRTSALAMGAKYKPDWDPSCTHLICAFPNTPKFNQVRGKGIIVTKKWISDCNLQRKRLPWRRYALDPSDQNQDESEEEIWEQDEEVEIENSPMNIEDGSDTEDEIERIQAKAKGDSPKPNKQSPENKRLAERYKDNSPKPFKASPNNKRKTISPTRSDSDTEDTKIIAKKSPAKTKSPKQLPSLPSFFDSKSFYLHDALSDSLKALLTKYIIAYGGDVVDDADSTSIDIFITTVEEIEDLKSRCNSSSTILTADWIWDCHNNKKLMPYEGFILSV